MVAVINPAVVDTIDEGVDIHPWQQFVHCFRTQVTSLHHNVSAVLAEKFGISWRPTDDPVWLLGCCYEVSEECGSDDAKELIDGVHTESEGPTKAVAETGKPHEFAEAWASITRMTYRKGFTPMYRPVRGSSVNSDERQRYIRLTSDAGWGCMIRVGQMLLATVLKRHHGDVESSTTGEPQCCAEVPTGPSEGEVRVPDSSYCSLSGSWACHQMKVDHPPPFAHEFLDDPCPERSQFSIFRFVRAAHGCEVTVPPWEDPACGFGMAGNIEGGACVGLAPARQLTQKLPGDWFGPTTISETIAALVEQSATLRGQLAVYVDSDGVLYEDEVRILAGCKDHLRTSSRYRQDSGAADKAIQGEAGSRIGAACDSDDEFMFVSTASVSSASAWSPLLSTVQADMSQSRELSPQRTDSGEECEEVGQNLYTLKLPPAALTEQEGCCAMPQASPLLPEVERPQSMANQDGSPRTARSNQPSWDLAVLLLFPLQLGLEKYISPDRAAAVLRYFELSSSLGAMGGRPRMAHFFVGRQGHELLYVDPHVVQAALSLEVLETLDGGSQWFPGAETFRNVPTVQTIQVEQIDSSVSFAFYCRDEAELQELLNGIQSIDREEAHAPIRSERSRPRALRAQVNGGVHGAWCDVEGLEHSFTEVQRRDELEDIPMGDLPQLDEDGEFETKSCVDTGTMHLGERAATLCVGSPWAVIEGSPP